MKESETKSGTGLQRLTLQQCRASFIPPLFMFLILSAFAFVQLHERHFVFCTLISVGALVQTIPVPALWKQYRGVKSGSAVYIKTAPAYHVPRVVSIVVMLLVTGFIVLASGFTLYVINLSFNTQTGWTIGAVAVLSVWLFIFYCWYRIFTQKSIVRPFPIEAVTAGVWPPAPLHQAQDVYKD